MPVGQLPQPRVLAGDALVPNEPTGVRLVGGAQAAKMVKVKKKDIFQNFLPGTELQGRGGPAYSCARAGAIFAEMVRTTASRAHFGSEARRWGSVNSRSGRGWGGG